jgi:DNA-binding beta-propeller fold protein YncE
MKRLRNLRGVSILGALFILLGQNTASGQTRPVLVSLNKADATLAIVDPNKMSIIAKVPTGEGPHEVVLTPDGKTAYVANYGNQTPGSSISIIDIPTAKETRRVDVSPLLRPHGIQLISGKLYFTAEMNRLIARYDPAANKIDWMMGSGQNGTHMVAGSADQKKFVTANIGSDSVTIFEFQNVPPAPGPSKITHVPVGKQPEAVDLSPDGKEVWMGLNVEGMVEVVDATTYKSVQKINTNGRPYRVRFTPDGKQVVCTILQTKELVVIDAASKKELKRIKLESIPLGIVFSNDGKTAFVTAGQPDLLLKVNLESGQVVARLDTGKVPDGVAVAGI